MASRPLTFVVGTGRCGSTALSRVLDLHPHVLSVNELFAAVYPFGFPDEPLTGEQFWHILSAPGSVSNRLVRDGVTVPEFLYPSRGRRFSAEKCEIPAISMMTLSSLTDDPDALFDLLDAELSPRPLSLVADHYRAFFDVLAEALGRRVVVERSGFSLQWVPEMRQTFPDARFVHIYRNGPDCALSMSRHPAFRILQTMYEHTTSPGRIVVEDLPPEVSALIADEETDVRSVLNRDVPLEKFGQMWSETIVAGLASLEELPPDARSCVAYEDLVTDPGAGLVALAADFGVEPLPDWLDAGCALLQDGRRGTADGLPEGTLAALRASCLPGMRALGLDG